MEPIKYTIEITLINGDVITYGGLSAITASEGVRYHLMRDLIIKTVITAENQVLPVATDDLPEETVDF